MTKVMSLQVQWLMLFLAFHFSRIQQSGILETEKSPKILSPNFQGPLPDIAENV